MVRFDRKNHSIINLGYHIIWIPKYRTHILKGHIKSIIEKSLLDKAEELNIKIEELEIMPDHIHIFIKCGPSISIAFIVGQLKGYSSYMLRSICTQYRRYKCLWAPSYYCESVGHISEETIKRYIQNQ